jgi:hypothetical protein
MTSQNLAYLFLNVTKGRCQRPPFESFVQIAGIVLLLALAGRAQVSRSAPKPVLYDDFSERFLDPTKWIPASSCFAGGDLQLECVREIQNKKLRLALRNFGARDSNSGFQFGTHRLFFANPASITSIRADIIYRDSSEIGCPDNTSGFGAGTSINGNFFNVGSGDPNDDIGAHLAFGHNLFDPPGQVNVFGQLSQGFNFFVFFPFGTTRMGSPVRAVLSWDQPNHQFLVNVTDLETGQVISGAMPYSAPDTTPAAAPYRSFDISTFPNNCIANPTAVFMDALYDNVLVK